VRAWSARIREPSDAPLKNALTIAALLTGVHDSARGTESLRAMRAADTPLFY
jgi:hypothetical protein